jgi:ABC-type transport system involved in cytochrome c biogenesis ATPase subunit
MAWITATTLDGRNANLNTSQIAAILDRVAGKPQEGSVVILTAGAPLELKESPAELLRATDAESASAPSSLPW